MINHYMEVENDQVVSISKCAGEIDGLDLIDERTYKKIEKMLQQDNGRVFFENGEPVRRDRDIRIERHPLIFKSGKVGNFEIRVSGTVATFWEGERLWMSNSDEAILELGSQITDSFGSVLVGGLGMGIVPLLIAQNQFVDKVTVYEKSPEVIELFHSQGFDKSKIEIVNEPIENATGFYDVACFDHYNLGDDMAESFRQIGEGLHCTLTKFYGQSDAELTVEQSQQIFDKLKAINDAREIPAPFDKRSVSAAYEKAVDALIAEGYSPTNKALITPAYGMYRLGDEEIWAIGMNWETIKGTMSAKYVLSEDRITDYYEIYDTGPYQSAQIDPSDGSLIATYENNGQIKRDAKNGEVQQLNSKNCLTNQDLLNQLSASGFYHFDRLNYYAHKPYGTVIEFDIVGLC